MLKTQDPVLILTPNDQFDPIKVHGSFLYDHMTHPTQRFGSIRPRKKIHVWGGREDCQLFRHVSVQEGGFSIKTDPTFRVTDEGGNLEVIAIVLDRWIYRESSRAQFLYACITRRVKNVWRWQGELEKKG